MSRFIGNISRYFLHQRCFCDRCGHGLPPNCRRLGFLGSLAGCRWLCRLSTCLLSGALQALPLLVLAEDRLQASPIQVIDRRCALRRRWRADFGSGGFLRRRPNLRSWGRRRTCLRHRRWWSAFRPHCRRRLGRSSTVSRRRRCSRILELSREGWYRLPTGFGYHRVCRLSSRSALLCLG